MRSRQLPTARWAKRQVLLRWLRRLVELWNTQDAFRGDCCKSGFVDEPIEARPAWNLRPTLPPERHTCDHRLESQSNRGASMYKYSVWVKVNQYQTAFTFVFAQTDWEAKALAEAQYGVGNVLNYTRIDE